MTPQRTRQTTGAAVVGLVLTVAAVALTLPHPPDYALPSLQASRPLVAEMTGQELDGGSGMRGDGSTIVVQLRDDSSVITRLQYTDRELALDRDGLPTGHRTIFDTVERCVRIVVSTDGPRPPAEGVATYEAALRRTVSDWYAEAPRDPCLGRPRTP